MLNRRPEDIWWALPGSPKYYARKLPSLHVSATLSDSSYLFWTISVVYLGAPRFHKFSAPRTYRCITLSHHSSRYHHRVTIRIGIFLPKVLRIPLFLIIDPSKKLFSSFLELCVLLLLCFLALSDHFTIVAFALRILHELLKAANALCALGARAFVKKFGLA